jgi:hypothetical protein
MPDPAMCAQRIGAYHARYDAASLQNANLEYATGLDEALRRGIQRVTQIFKQPGRPHPKIRAEPPKRIVLSRAALEGRQGAQPRYDIGVTTAAGLGRGDCLPNAGAQ